MSFLNEVCNSFTPDFLTIAIPIVIVLLTLITFSGNVQRVRINPKHSVVIITGCDSGFGLGLAEKLVSQGYLVFATCMTDAGIKHLKPLVTDVTLCDVTKEENILNLSNLVNDFLRKNTDCRLWCLVNNAGVAPAGLIDWLPMDIFRLVMEINCFAPIRLTKEFLPLLKRTRGSRIINLSSVAGLTASPYLGPYSGSKHALEGVGKALRDELKPWGIHVCHINPGFMK
jgi:NAD(P)-dependent dehydrogenase (short-subunit alcohol dehydrogenase family)